MHIAGDGAGGVFATGKRRFSNETFVAKYDGAGALLYTPNSKPYPLTAKAPTPTPLFVPLLMWP